MTDRQKLLVQHFGPGCLAGISVSGWLALLAENGFRVSPRYFGKAAFLTISSLCTTICRPLEHALYGKQLADHRASDPVFILGSWRSGTTHLHNLLCLDDQFVSPDLFQTMYPHTFLISQRWLRPLLDFFVPKKRFMDNMDMGLREPAEDEMALAILSGRSNMLSWTFPGNAAFYDRFLGFGDASEKDRSAWKQQFDFFVRKITFRSGKQPLLKSPNHTARIRMILELYPNARFLHLKRNPYDVYRSLNHMARQVIPVWGLQSYPVETTPDMVIGMYQRLYADYFEQLSLIPAGQFHEVAYEDLIQSPLSVLEQTYLKLRLGDFEIQRTKFQRYVAAKSDYQRNRHTEIPAAVRETLGNRWRRSFEAWGYDIDDGNSHATEHISADSRPTCE